MCRKQPIVNPGIVNAIFIELIMEIYQHIHPTTLWSTSGPQQLIVCPSQYHINPRIPTKLLFNGLSAKAEIDLMTFCHVKAAYWQYIIIDNL